MGACPQRNTLFLCEKVSYSRCESSGPLGRVGNGTFQRYEVAGLFVSGSSALASVFFLPPNIPYPTSLLHRYCNKCSHAAPFRITLRRVSSAAFCAAGG